MKRKLLMQKKIWLPVLLICIPVIARSKQASEGILTGLRLCGANVIPALFPYFVACNLFLLCGFRLPKHLRSLFSRSFQVSEEGANAFVFGLTGGYPLGAKTVSTLYENGLVRSDEARKLLLFCNNTGPAFFLGVAGGKILGSLPAGLLLYLLHIVSALLTGFFVRIFLPGGKATCRIQKEAREVLPFSRAFPQAVISACSSMINISAFVIFFTAFQNAICTVPAIQAMLCTLAGLLRTSYAAVCSVFLGFFEMTSGVMALQEAEKGPLAFCLLSWIINWGSLCIHFQTLSQLPKNIGTKGYYGFKLLQSLLSVCLSVPVGLVLFSPKSSLHMLIFGLFCILLAIILSCFFIFTKKAAKNSRKIHHNPV